MKKTLFLTAISVVLIIAGLMFVNKSKEESMIIGGQRDAQGCLLPAGYSYDNEIGACVRKWELDDGGKIKAAISAASELKKTVSSYGLTVVEVEVFKCPGCYRVAFEKEQKKYEVNLKNWNVAEDSFEKETISSFAECTAAGNPVIETYPRQCNFDGENFVEDIYVDEQELNEDEKTIATDTWEIYKDDNAGFSLKYPQNVSMYDIEGDIRLKIESEKIENLEGMMGFNEVTALLNEESLNNGEYGKDVDWPLEESKKVVKIGDLNAQEFMVLSRLEVCDVVFERKLYFFNKGYQIVVTLTGPKDIITREEADFFKEDDKNCGEEKVWNFEKQGDFYMKLKNGEAGEAAQKWFDIFDDIKGTINFTKEDENIAIEGFWISEVDADYMTEFRDNKKIDYYGGVVMSESQYEIVNGVDLRVLSEDILEYKIVELKSNSLVLIYKDRGNELRFKRK